MHTLFVGRRESTHPQDVYKLFEKAPQAVWEEVHLWVVKDRFGEENETKTDLYLFIYIPWKLTCPLKIGDWKMYFPG